VRHSIGTQLEQDINQCNLHQIPQHIPTILRIRLIRPDVRNKNSIFMKAFRYSIDEVDTFAMFFESHATKRGVQETAGT